MSLAKTMDDVEPVTLAQYRVQQSTNKKVGIVVPTLNCKATMEKTLLNITKLLPDAVIFAIDDKSDDGTLDLLKEHNAVVPYCSKRRGYGKSLVEGLQRAFYEYDCDYIIEMDADHPVAPIKDFVEALDTGEYDMIIGTESGKRPSRIVAMFLSKLAFGLQQFRHPTCGYIAFTRDGLRRIFDSYHLKANNDFVHIELLYRAKCLKLRFGQLPFNGKEHEKHRMSTKRVAKWLWSFSFLLTRRAISGIWRGGWRNWIVHRRSTIETKATVREIMEIPLGLTYNFEKGRRE